MLDSMKTILSENYKSYTKWTVIAFIPTLIATIFFSGTYAILASLSLAFAYFLGFWFGDIYKTISPNVTKSDYSALILPVGIFLIFLLVASILFQVIFGGSFGFVRMLACFALAAFIRQKF